MDIVMRPNTHITQHIGRSEYIGHINQTGSAPTAKGEKAMKIVFRFKNGYELPITCKTFTLTKHSILGEITGYHIEGIEDNKPLFFRMEDVECIYQKMDGEEE